MLVLTTLTTLLLSLPLVSATALEASPLEVSPFEVIHRGLLPRQNPICRENGRDVCDNSCMAVGSTCCNKGDGTYCTAGLYCVTGGCCSIGRVCTGTAGTRTNTILTGGNTALPTTTGRLVLPSINIPSISIPSAPSFPSFSAPSLPAISIPSAPSFPAFSAPSISFPSLPSFNSPGVTAPSNPGSGATGLKPRGSMVMMVGGVAAAMVFGAAVLL